MTRDQYRRQLADRRYERQQRIYMAAIIVSLAVFFVVAMAWQ